MSRFGTFNINGQVYDLDDFTLDEVEQIEELCGGAPFSDLAFGSAKAMKAIAFTLMQRTDPEIEMSDVGTVKLIDFLPADEEMPKLPPEEEASPAASDPAASGARLSVASTPG
jgi:hypothetical protein